MYRILHLAKVHELYLKEEIKMEYKEKYMSEFMCGCKKELGLPIGGGFWNPTGNNSICKSHTQAQGTTD